MYHNAMQVSLIVGYQTVMDGSKIDNVVKKVSQCIDENGALQFNL